MRNYIYQFPVLNSFNYTVLAYTIYFSLAINSFLLTLYCTMLILQHRNKYLIARIQYMVRFSFSGPHKKEVVFHLLSSNPYLEIVYHLSSKRETENETTVLEYLTMKRSLQETKTSLRLFFRCSFKHCLIIGILAKYLVDKLRCTISLS